MTAMTVVSTALARKVAATPRTFNAVFYHNYAYTVCGKKIGQKGCTSIAVEYRVDTKTEKLNEAAIFICIFNILYIILWCYMFLLQKVNLIINKNNITMLDLKK